MPDRQLVLRSQDGSRQFHLKRVLSLGSDRQLWQAVDPTSPEAAYRVILISPPTSAEVLRLSSQARADLENLNDLKDEGVVPVTDFFEADDPFGGDLPVLVATSRVPEGSEFPVWCLHANERTPLDTLQGFIPACRALDRLHGQRTQSGDVPSFGELRPSDLRISDGTVLLPGLALLDEYPGRGVATDRKQLADLIVLALFGEQVSDVKGAFQGLTGNSDMADQFQDFANGVLSSRRVAEC
jgi:hypothetical protein